MARPEEPSLVFQGSECLGHPLWPHRHRFRRLLDRHHHTISLPVSYAGRECVYEKLVLDNQLMHTGAPAPINPPVLFSVKSTEMMEDTHVFFPCSLCTQLRVTEEEDDMVIRRPVDSSILPFVLLRNPINDIAGDGNCAQPLE